MELAGWYFEGKSSLSCRYLAPSYYSTDLLSPRAQRVRPQRPGLRLLHRCSSSAAPTPSCARGTCERPGHRAVQVTKRFGPKLAVNAVTLTVPQGQVYGLIGPNGAGKTTTFSMMCGFLHPTAGTLRCMGVMPDDAGRPQGQAGRAAPGRPAPARLGDRRAAHLLGAALGAGQPEREAARGARARGPAEAWATRPRPSRTAWPSAPPWRRR